MKHIIFSAFYTNVKNIIENQKAGANSPENKISEITSAIRQMEEILKQMGENNVDGQTGA